MLLEGEAFIQWRMMDNFPWIADIMMEAIFLMSMKSTEQK